MKPKNRKRFDAAFKTRIALEAVQEKARPAQIGKRHGVHPVQVGQWKRQLLEHAAKAGTVRFLGTFLTDPTGVPTVIVKYVAGQLEIEPSCIDDYRNAETHQDHAAISPTRLCTSAGCGDCTLGHELMAHAGRFLAAHRRFASWNVEHVALAPEIGSETRASLNGEGFLVQDLNDLTAGL